jgi:hypothetical protein
MKRLFEILMVIGVITCITSCSCGIYRDEFVPVSNKKPLTEETAKQVAMRNGFSERTMENGATRFQNEDIEILYQDSKQLLVVRSSICPFFAMPSNSDEWQSRCELISSKIAGGFQGMGVPVRKLTSQERIE